MRRHTQWRLKLTLLIATTTIWFAYAVYDGYDSSLPSPAPIPSINAITAK